jgi:hypothetical protein
MPHASNVPSISIPGVPFDFSLINRADGGPPHVYHTQGVSQYYPDPGDFYSSGDDRDQPRYPPSIDPPVANRGGPSQIMPPFPIPGLAFDLQGPTNMGAPFERPTMQVYSSGGGPGNFTQIQSNTKKRPKYTRSKAGCLTCRTKKIKACISRRLSPVLSLRQHRA